MMDLRSRFPLLVSRPDLVYLDSASSTQRVDSALAATDRYYREMNANVHRGLYSLSEEATTAYEAVREIVRAFVGGRDAREVVFTRGTTESLNMVAQGWGGQNLAAGDEVVLTMMEHHSNLVPWQMVAERTGAVLRFVGLTDEGGLDYEALESLVSERTKMVSVTGLSNVLGTLVDVARVARAARHVGAKVCVDAAQLAAHRVIDRAGPDRAGPDRAGPDVAGPDVAGPDVAGPDVAGPDVAGPDVDFLAFSSHKIYGPTGAGVLVARRKLLEAMEPWMGGGGMIREVGLEGSTWNEVPWKFEAGTPPIAQVIGMGAAIEFLQEVGMEAVAAHDRELMEYARERLRAIPDVRLFGPREAVGVLSFEVAGVHSHDVAAILAEHGVCIRAGHHCCMPLMKTLGVTGTCRASFGVYNSKPDIDRLVSALEGVRQVFF